MANNNEKESYVFCFDKRPVQKVVKKRNAMQKIQIRTVILELQ